MFCSSKQTQVTHDFPKSAKHRSNRVRFDKEHKVARDWSQGRKCSQSNSEDKTQHP